MGSDVGGIQVCPRYDDFNPRSRMGSDRFELLLDPIKIYFNPRSRMGSDWRVRRRYSSYAISIHAPAWGATGNGNQPVVAATISIHAPAWGATCVQWAFTYSTRYFNPRSRMGSDPRNAHPNQRHSISIHAPAWGATCAVSKCAPDTIISIHAPAWGATATTDSIFRYVDDIIRYCEQCAAAVAY